MTAVFYLCVIWNSINKKYFLLIFHVVGHCRLCEPVSLGRLCHYSDSGVIENVGVDVGISVMYHSISEIQCTSGLQSVILNPGSMKIPYMQYQAIRLLFLT